MAERIAFSILGKIAENLVEPIGRQFGYIFCYNNNIDSLKSEVDKLKKMRLGVQMCVDAGRKNLENVEPYVESWLTSVDEMSEGAERIVQAKVEVEKGCLYGWCPNLKSRYSLSRKAKKQTMAVVELQTNSKFDRVTYPAPPAGIPSTGGFKGLESRISITEEVLRALKDDTIRMIGICGMGGVGKTTMVKEVAEKAKARNLFDEVVMAVVSQNPDFTKIQRELGDMLGLKYDEQNILARAGRLCKRLTNGNRILVILDDVWEGIDLREVGIPLGADRKGCKVVLTSRLQRVCSDMGTQKDFTVQVLSKEEAWDLFKEMTGHSVDTVDLHPIAKEVVQECGGLPIALVTLGRALKNKGKHVWNDALQQLRRSSVTHIPGMQKKVYLSIELSYNYLESAQAKSLLLLCCLFPEDYNIWIEDLVRYVVGLRLFEDVETVAEARDRIYSVVDELRRSSLLLAGDEVFVKLHDVVRDVGIAIASKGEHLYLVRHDNKLEEWPDKERCEPCTAISLTSNSMHELPDGLDCPKLKLLRLESTSRSLNISEDFFGRMKDLMVIGFRDVRLKRLPPSLEFLMNLRTLCLHSCDFSTNISIIGSLTTLEILSFSNSHLKELPSEIGQLCKLKLLDLRSKRSDGIKIPAGVLSNLSKLEELYIGRVNWKPEEFRENASITELNSLSRLKALEILIDAEVLPRDFCFQRLMRFRIGMGNKLGGFPSYQFQNSLTFRVLEMSMILETNVNVLLKTTEILNFYQVKGMKNVLMELDVEGYEKLKELSIMECDEVEYLIDAMDLVPDSAFVSLESLRLTNMHNLKEICNGNPPVGFLSRLQRLDLWGLPEMKSLWWASIQPECLGNLRFLDINFVDTIESVFTESIVKGLVQLQELWIGCCNMEEIVAMEGGEDDKGAEKIEFPNLNILTLEELPNLRSFYPKSDIGAIASLFNQKIILRSMEKLDIRGLNNLVQIVDNEQMQTDSFHKLRILKVSRCAKLINIASSDQIKMFNNLEMLDVMSCGTLEVVFDFKGLKVNQDQVKVFNNLEKLRVSDCGTLEVVFDFKGLKVNQEHAVIALGQPRSLTLKHLPKLTHVWRMVPKGIHGLQNLRSLEVERCDNLRYLLSISMAKLLVKLQELKLERCAMMEEVIETEKEEEEAKEVILFPELNSITLYDLKNLESFVSGSYTSKWDSLKTLFVWNCPKLKAFHLESPSVQKVKTIDIRKSEKQQENNCHIPTLTHFFNEKVAFPSLESLQLSAMMNLDVVWHGQLPYAHFGKLREIKVVLCYKLLNVISSKNLKTLMIEECASPSPLNFLPSLRNLEKLTITACASLLEVFDFKGGQETEDGHSVKLQISSDCPPKPVHVEEGEERIDKIVFPKLTTLVLQHLENLSIFCYGNYDFEFPSLENVTIEECPKMRTFCSRRPSAPKLTQVYTDDKGSVVWNGDLNSTIQHLSQKSLQKLEIKNSLASSSSIEDALSEEDA